MITFHTVDLNHIRLHYAEATGSGPALAGTLLNGHNPDQLLARIRCPVHLVTAQVALTAEDVQRAISHMPHSTHAVIENTGHDIHLDQPETVVEEVERFLIAL